MGDRPVAVITGSSRGIGRGLAEYFLGRDYAVAGCSRGPATIDRPGYHHTSLDLGDEKQVRDWIRTVKMAHDRIDVLVSNAGLVRPPRLLTVTSGDVLDEFLRTNVAGVYHVLREVSKVMLLRGAGRIITMSSVATALHAEGTSAYAASKSAATEMTKVLARELAPRGITCNVIAPSLVMTDATEALAAEREWHQQVIGSLTIKRAVSMAEICHVAAFLAAPESGCITGQVITLGLVT
jgi:3-oxoacyl-[acyl-carrier protein] reductase